MRPKDGFQNWVTHNNTHYMLSKRQILYFHAQHIGLNCKRYVAMVTMLHPQIFTHKHDPLVPLPTRCHTLRRMQLLA